MAGIEILLTVALPDITLGVMSLTNMKIDVGLGIPFDGSPVDFRFAFCSREAPFTLTVWVFGGGGFVGLVITVEGVVLLEFSFEFGGGWAIDVVVASGKVEAKAGIYFKLETVEENGKQVQKVHLEAYFRLHGSVDVMGLITASITLYLALIYESPPATLVGEASIVIEVEVLVFSGSVEIKVRKNLHKEEENANLGEGGRTASVHGPGRNRGRGTRSAEVELRRPAHRAAVRASTATPTHRSGAEMATQSIILTAVPKGVVGTPSGLVGRVLVHVAPRLLTPGTVGRLPRLRRLARDDPRQAVGGRVPAARRHRTGHGRGHAARLAALDRAVPGGHTGGESRVQGLRPPPPATRIR